MDDLISRQAALEALGDMPMSWADTDAEIQAQEDWKKYREALLNLPTAEKKGKWHKIKKLLGGEVIFYSCSECGMMDADKTLFCPMCGARMED